MNIQLKNLQEQAREIGRAVVMVAPTRWVPGQKLVLQHIADTEGDISVAANESYVHLTLPELTGAAKHKSYVEGEDPVVTMPIFVADPAIRALVSPAGNAGGGYSRRRPVKERTLVLFPEQLFYDAAEDKYTSLTYTAADGWQVNGKELTEEQERLLALSMWFWRGYFTRPSVPFRHGEAGKTVESVSFQVMHAGEMPDGHQLYTLGDPADAEIDIDPVGP
jgi:hypothetical protein